MKWRGGYKYQVVEDEVIKTPICPKEDIKTRFLWLQRNGTLTIWWGYAYDGASGPTFDRKIGWGRFSIKLTDTMVPTAVHDAFAQLMREGLLSREWLPQVNILLNQMLKDRGMWWLRRRWWLRGVKLTGGSFADPKNAKEIFTSL